MIIPTIRVTKGEVRYIRWTLTDPDTGLPIPTDSATGEVIAYNSDERMFTVEDGSIDKALGAVGVTRARGVFSKAGTWTLTLSLTFPTGDVLIPLATLNVMDNSPPAA